MKDMSIRGKVWVKPIDQMDVWLDSEGYYRKHTARDGSCLFRAVSEQVFLTQVFHVELRKQILAFMLRNEQHFQKLINCPLMEYTEKMNSPREWGGRVEIEAMSVMYKCDFLLFQEMEKPAENITNNGFKRQIMLCYSQDRHYDSVYTKEYITTAAFCQSTVYELLYKRVFGLKEVDYAVNKMLHDKSSRYHQREHVPFLSSGFALRLEMRDSYQNVKELLDFGITPFPYKIAKALDVEIYRNVEYDTWNEYRKGLRYGFCPWTCQELQVGAKCTVKLENENYHGHVQEMQPNKGPVLVFIEELGEMRSVPFESLELLPPVSPTAATPKPEMPLKLHPLQLVELKTGKKVTKSSTGKMKNGRDSELNGRSEKQTKNSKEANSPQAPVVSSTEFCEEDIEHQEDLNGYNAQQFQVNPEGDGQVSPDTTKPEIVPTVAENDNFQYPVYQAPLPPPPPPPSTATLAFPLEPVTTYQAPPAVNFMAPKSLNADGSDLPHTDVTTLRFFYNLGLDHLRMNYVVRPTPTYYVNSPAIQPGFIALESPTVPTYETFPVANQGGKRQNTYEGMPLVQQCEVSSSVNPAPTQPMPPPQVTTFYQPAESEQYCVSMPYIEYSYDYPIYSSSPHSLIPSSYITPDGVIYQTIMTQTMYPPSI